MDKKIMVKRLPPGKHSVKSISLLYVILSTVTGGLRLIKNAIRGAIYNKCIL